MPKFPEGLTQNERKDYLERFFKKLPPNPDMPLASPRDLDIIARDFEREEHQHAEKRMRHIMEIRRRQEEYRRLMERNRPLNIGEDHRLRNAMIDPVAIRDDVVVVPIRNPMELFAMMGLPIAMAPPRREADDMAEAIRRSLEDH